MATTTMTQHITNVQNDALCEMDEALCSMSETELVDFQQMMDDWDREIAEAYEKWLASPAAEIEACEYELEDKFFWKTGDYFSGDEPEVAIAFLKDYLNSDNEMMRTAAMNLIKQLS